MAIVSLADALAEERRALRGEQAAIDNPLFAVCLSGGGIRSASFALGVLQGLADRGLLKQFDYLSTVSGGGFAGGWLSAWLHHAAARGDVDAVFQELRRHALPSGAAEAPEVSRVREYSRYMSPALGALSVDSWTLAATMLRNVVLNWLVLLPMVAAALLVPAAYLEAVQYFDRPTEGAAPWSLGPVVLLAASLLALALAIGFVVANLPSYADRRGGSSRFAQHCLTPLLISAIGLPLFWASDVVEPDLAWMIGGAIAINLAVWMIAGAVAGTKWFRPRTWLAAVASAPIGAAGLWWLMIGPFREGVALGRLYCATSVPLILILWALQTTAFVALAREEQSDADLEWHSRLLGWLLMTATVWLAVAVLVFYAPLAYREVVDVLEARLAMSRSAGAGLLGAIGSLAGALFTQLMRRAPASTSAPRGAMTRVMSALAAPALVIALLGALAWLNVTVMRELTTWPSLEWLRITPGGRDADDVTSAEVLVAAALLLAVGAIMARFVPVNRFSLNGMYRQRLIRAFLGASRQPEDRRANPFTGFDEHDNLAMQELVPKPMLIVNATLNRVTEPGLAMQFRKAESFTISRLHAGAPVLDAFRPISEYADEQRGLVARSRKPGMSLGTALSISGAAASPNMGARSSPALAFLMTLFNARLGVWLGNPGKSGDETWRQPEPSQGAGPIVRELLGRTSDRSPYVYLSDGGHFDNLGLWTMVQRRCRGIVVSDAGADPDYAFDDLANAIRMIRIDHGVPIVFAQPLPMRGGDQRSGASFAVARIMYSVVDGTPVERDGVLIYIKATLTGTEAVDILNYKAGHATFPHESTADQWFTEAQFESYRVLGRTSASRMVAHFSENELPAFFDAVRSAELK